MRQRRHAPAVMGSARHRPVPSFRWLLLLLVVLGTQAASLTVPTSGALAAGPLKMPFAAGSEWYISQGYNTSPAEGWSHYNCDPGTGKDQISKTQSCEDGWQYKYSFDLRQVDGTEAGEIALAPVNGTIRWLDPANGGLSINLGDGFAIGIFHLDLARGLAEGQPVTQGQPLGTGLDRAAATTAARLTFTSTCGRPRMAATGAGTPCRSPASTPWTATISPTSGIGCATSIGTRSSSRPTSRSASCRARRHPLPRRRRRGRRRSPRRPPPRLPRGPPP